MKIAVTGHPGGMVRDYLVKMGVTPINADITDKQAVMEEIALLDPDVVIHAAAYTGVENCEKNYKTAFQVNVRGTAHVADACKNVGARIIYLSTCHVFDGKKPVSDSYTEMSRPKPLNKYGFTKWEGEEVLTVFGGKYIIVRISKLFSAEQYREYVHQPYKSVEPTFMWRNYTYLPHFVDGLLQVANNHINYLQHMKLHLGTSSAVDLCNFKRMVLYQAGYDPKDYITGRRDDLDGYLPRPNNGILKMDVALEHGIELPLIQDGVKQMLKEM